MDILAPGQSNVGKRKNFKQDYKHPKAPNNKSGADRGTYNW